jgi:hypothetical protein
VVKLIYDRNDLRPFAKVINPEFADLLLSFAPDMADVSGEPGKYVLREAANRLSARHAKSGTAANELRRSAARTTSKEVTAGIEARNSTRVGDGGTFPGD